MERRMLGTPGIEVSAIGLGCMGLSQGYGAADDGESVRLIHEAVALGVTLLDTAQSYGNGHNETLIGTALRSMPVGERDAVQIATKVGIVRGADGVHLDAHPDRIAGYLDASLHRLGVDHIDLYYLHRVDPSVPIEDSIGAMGSLVQQGKIRHLGVSEVTAQQLESAYSAHPIAALQTEWSLMWRNPERDVLPSARELGVGVVPYSPLGRGLLSGSLNHAQIAESEFRSADPRFAADVLLRNQRQVGVLSEIAAERGVRPAQLALAWLLAQGPDVVPIPGTRIRDRLAENAAAAAISLTDDEVRRIDRSVSDGFAGDRRSFAAPDVTRVSPGRP